MPHRLKIIALAGLMIILTSGCTSFPSLPYNGDLQHGWQRANLLLLKDPGSLDPEHAMIALYMRQQPEEFEFRLDLLDMQDPLSNTVILALDTQPGGSNQLPSGAAADLDWDVLLVLPASGAPYTLDSDGDKLQNLVPRVIRDKQLQTVIVTVNPAFLPGNANQMHLQAFLIDPASGNVYDRTPVADSGSPSLAAAPLLFAFWDVLPASTPVQSLRRWDGAHTGPMGRRHGLSILVNEATSRNIPLTLLDLKTPESLSALDLLGGTNWLRRTEVKGLLNLPLDALSDTAGSQSALEYSTQAALAFGFRSSPIGYGAFDPNALPPLRAFYVALPGLQHPVSWNGHLFIPLPFNSSSGQVEADENGPSVDFKKQLIRVALSPENDLLAAGGSMPASILADSAVAPLFFEYLATHPWIEPLSESRLMGFPAQKTGQLPLAGCADLLCKSVTDSVPYTSQGQTIPSGLSAAQIREKIRAQLTLLPASKIKDQAWQAYFRLSSPVQADEVPAVQANYIGQVGYLVAAAKWAQNPAPEADCTRDIDWDGQPECILSTKNVFTVIELDGGRLVFAGTRSGTDVQQWIGQKSQFLINWDLADSMKVEAGPGSDPSEIPGAFFDQFGYFSLSPAVSKGEIRFSTDDNKSQKSYTLSNDILRINIQSSMPVATRIPLVLDAPGRFKSGWFQSYPLPHLSGDSWAWQPPGQPGIQVNVENAALSASSFLDLTQFLQQPEIPDRTYPPGHYLPFPLAVLDLKAGGNYAVNIRFHP